MNRPLRPDGTIALTAADIGRKLAVPRIQPMTPEEAAAWEARKFAQWEAIEAALKDSSLTLALIQTQHTFVVRVLGPGGFEDEMCIGDPAKSVTKDDRTFNLSAVDMTGPQISAALQEWKLLRKLPPPPDRLQGRDAEGQAARDKRMGRA